MKRIKLANIIFALGFVTFTGCAYKTTCGVDECGDRYVDKTYRTYKTNDCDANDLMQKDCKSSPVYKTNIKHSSPSVPKNTPILTYDKPLKISVVGQGVAPCHGTCSPAQSYAMAKRAAIADAYRLIAEKVKGVYVEGDDYIKNMMVKRSTVKTSVAAHIRNANVVETTFKEGLCEVEMEIVLSHSDFAQ